MGEVRLSLYRPHTMGKHESTPLALWHIEDRHFVPLHKVPDIQPSKKRGSVKEDTIPPKKSCTQPRHQLPESSENTSPPASVSPKTAPGSSSNTRQPASETPPGTSSNTGLPDSEMPPGSYYNTGQLGSEMPPGSSSNTGQLGSAMPPGSSSNTSQPANEMPPGSSSNTGQPGNEMPPGSSSKTGQPGSEMPPGSSSNTSQPGNEMPPGSSSNTGQPGSEIPPGSLLNTNRHTTDIPPANKLPEIPHQPECIKFPKREFGRKKPVYRSFQSSWFKTWPWLHYVEEQDKVLCHTCARAFHLKQISSTKIETSFIKDGYSNWKDATTKSSGFTKHQNSDCHRESVERLISLPDTIRDVGEHLSEVHEESKVENRRKLLSILSNLRFLARQGLALRGDGDEKNSNFMQLFWLMESKDDAERWLSRKTNKYTSANIQNELLKVMGLQLLRDIASCIHQSSFFSIMADETTDNSNREQVVVCIRWIDDALVPRESFVGFQQVDCINAATIGCVIKDTLLRMNVALGKCRGQCYDGCSTMSGSKNGVVQLIKREEPRALYTHCYGHALNLACSDSIKRSKVMKDALDTTHEITKLVKKSPKRDAQLEKIQNEFASDEGNVPNIRLLCPTRWTVRAQALESIISNYFTLQELWTWALDHCSDSEMKARIRGVQLHMTTFDFFYGLVLGQTLLQHADSLSETLQTMSMSAADAQKIASMTLKTLHTIRSDDHFSLFWDRVTQMASAKDVNDPKLPRQRKAPRRYDEGLASPEFENCPRDMYRRIYYEALDLLITSISDRFNQPDYATYIQCEELLLKAAKGKAYESELQHVTVFYGSDFSLPIFRCHLTTFTSTFTSDGSITLNDVIAFLRSLSPAQQNLMSSVITLAKLILVMPATNASSERSFSALRRVKNYLRSTMTQSRLNHLMLLHIHKEQSDQLNLVSIANQFVQGSEHRQSLFGRFTVMDLGRSSVPVRSKGTMTVADTHSAALKKVT